MWARPSVNQNNTLNSESKINVSNEQKDNLFKPRVEYFSLKRANRIAEQTAINNSILNNTKGGDRAARIASGKLLITLGDLPRFMGRGVCKATAVVGSAALAAYIYKK